MVNNTVVHDTKVVTVPELDLSITKVDSVDPVKLGKMTKYTVRVTNNGPSAATNVVMTDVFPAPGKTATAVFSYQGGITVDAGGTCAPAPAVGATSGSLVCTFPTLAANQSATVTYDMRAESLTVADAKTGTAFNEASVKADETETNMVNNTVVHDTSVGTDPIVSDLAVTKKGPEGIVPPGSEVDFVLTVTNLGPLDSAGSTLVDVLPSGLSFVSAPGCAHEAGTVTCDVGPLKVNDTKVFMLKTLLSQDFTNANVVNKVLLNADGDTVLTNNEDEATVTTSPSDVTSIPTLSEWGLLLLSCLMGLLVWRQMRVARRW